MFWTVLLTCLLIVVARVTDITLDTVRTVAIVQGRRLFAAALGLVEAVIYIAAVSQVLRTDHLNWFYVLAYGLGFAAGTYIGITVEQVLAFGEQLVAIFTRTAEAMVNSLRAEGYRVTEFAGRGRDGEVSALFVQVPRRQARKLTVRARAIDPHCFYIVNDVRAASTATATPPERAAA